MRLGKPETMTFAVCDLCDNHYRGDDQDPCPRCLADLSGKTLGEVRDRLERLAKDKRRGLFEDEP